MKRKKSYISPICSEQNSVHLLFARGTNGVFQNFPSSYIKSSCLNLKRIDKIIPIFRGTFYVKYLFI